jgi:hypothetical protein
VPLSPEEQRLVDDAIVNGVWYLEDHQAPGGTWGNPPVGCAALPGLTLLECGVPGSDPVVQKVAHFVREQAPKLTYSSPYDTYQVALAILFLDRLGEYKDKEHIQDEKLIQYLALRLVAGQRPDDGGRRPDGGGWDYTCPALDRRRTQELLTRLREDKVSLDQWRKAALNGKAFGPGRFDNSNTQFAVLALWVARRHDVPIDRTVALVERHFRRTQLLGQGGAAVGDPKGDNLNLDGSWLYDTGVNSSHWPTMTCSGLLGLAVAHGVSEDGAEKQQKPLGDPAVKRALAMLAREIDRPGEERDPDLYFLWSLERVGVLYDLPKIDDKDWYAWGRKVLLSMRQPDGSWKGGAYYGNTPVLNTCFALLFLKQANLAPDLTDKLRLLEKK